MLIYYDTTNLSSFWTVELPTRHLPMLPGVGYYEWIGDIPMGIVFVTRPASSATGFIGNLTPAWIVFCLLGYVRITTPDYGTYFQAHFQAHTQCSFSGFSRT